MIMGCNTCHESSKGSRPTTTHILKTEEGLSNFLFCLVDDSVSNSVSVSACLSANLANFISNSEEASKKLREKKEVT